MHITHNLTSIRLLSRGITGHDHSFEFSRGAPLRPASSIFVGIPGFALRTVEDLVWRRILIIRAIDCTSMSYDLLRPGCALGTASALQPGWDRTEYINKTGAMPDTR